MIIEILLGTIFITSTGVLMFLLSQKLSELVAIPDHVITEHIKVDATKFQLFLLHFKSFFRDGRYKDVFGRFAGKFLHRLHIVLMKIDYAITERLRFIRMRQNSEEQKTAGVDAYHDDKDSEIFHSSEEPKFVSPVFAEAKTVEKPLPSPAPFSPIPPVAAPVFSSVVVRPKRLAVVAELKEQDGVQHIPLARKVSLPVVHADAERQVREKAEPVSIEPSQDDAPPKRRVRRSKIVPPEARE
ncbi:MAG: hypothetical protein HYT37_00985 [Candidatus Sungbacteria bacterium]|nr:hypothetical protein [Candidatus Sungbacteria bacterium]